MKTRKAFSLACGAFAAACIAVSASAQTEVFQARFENGDPSQNPANWIERSFGQSRITYNFDYAAIGLITSPRSKPGDGNRAVKFEANMSDGVVSGATIFPVGGNYDATQGYTLSFDLWINANGPFPAGGTGSTEYFTAGIGSNTLVPNVQASGQGSGGWVAASGEGGSTRDYRAFKNTNEQFAESGQFRAGNVSNGAHDAGNAFYTSKFAGKTAPPFQQFAFPQQSGTTADGTLAFAWHQVDIVVNETSAQWLIDGHEIATLRTDIGSTFPTSGNIALGYMDIFASVSDNETLSFGLIDNVSVTVVPEPAALSLLGLGALAGLRRRRKA